MIERARIRLRDLFSFPSKSHSPRLENPLTLEATRLFVEASMNYPSSVIGQGSYIAQQYQQKGGIEIDGQAVHLFQLKDEVLHDKLQLDYLRRTAAAVHKKRNSGPKRVGRQALKDIIDADFDVAQQMLRLNTDEIKDIQSRYRIYFDRKIAQNYDSAKAEESLRNYVLHTYAVDVKEIPLFNWRFRALSR